MDLPHQLDLSCWLQVNPQRSRLRQLTLEVVRPIRKHRWLSPSISITSCGGLSESSQGCTKNILWNHELRSNSDPVSNPFLPSSFDRFFAKCTAISTTRETWILNKIILNSSIIFLVPPALFHSEDLNTPIKSFPSLPCCQLFPIWIVLLIQQTLALLILLNILCQWTLIS